MKGLILEDVWLKDSQQKKKYFLEAANYEIQMDRNVGVLMLPGENRYNLMRCIYGASLPFSGQVYRNCRVSWPLQWTHYLATTLTGRENIHFVARLYGLPLRKYTNRVAALAEIADVLDKPVSTYPKEMRMRLNFVCCISIPFDFYIGEEGMRVGVKTFHQKCDLMVSERLKSSRFIIFAAHPGHFTRFSPDLLYIRDKNLSNFATLAEATHYFNTEMKGK